MNEKIRLPNEYHLQVMAVEDDRVAASIMRIGGVESCDEEGEKVLYFFAHDAIAHSYVILRRDGREPLSQCLFEARESEVDPVFVSRIAECSDILAERFQDDLDNKPAEHIDLPAGYFPNVLVGSSEEPDPGIVRVVKRSDHGENGVWILLHHLSCRGSYGGYLTIRQEAPYSVWKILPIVDGFDEVLERMDPTLFYAWQKDSESRRFPDVSGRTGRVSMHIFKSWDGQAWKYHRRVGIIRVVEED